MKHLEIFILYTDKTEKEKEETERIQMQLSDILSLLQSDVDDNYFHISDDFMQDMRIMIDCDIIVDTGSCGESAKTLLMNANYMDKNIIEDDELSDVFLFKKHLNDIINARK